jgi:hypothetical protein
MKDRNIDNNQSGLTRLNAKQYDVILQALSRLVVVLEGFVLRKKTDFTATVLCS